MKKTLLRIIILVSTIAILSVPGRLMEPLVLTSGNPLGGWFPLVHLSHNAYHMWRIDHLTQLCVYLFSPWYSVDKPLFRLFLIYLGTLLVTRRIASSPVQGNIATWIGSLVPTIIMLDVVGIDPVVLGTIVWIPFIGVLGAKIITENPQPSWWILPYMHSAGEPS